MASRCAVSARSWQRNPGCGRDESVTNRRSSSFYGHFCTCRRSGSTWRGSSSPIWSVWSRDAFFRAPRRIDILVGGVAVAPHPCAARSPRWRIQTESATIPRERLYWGLGLSIGLHLLILALLLTLLPGLARRFAAARPIPAK